MRNVLLNYKCRIIFKSKRNWEKLINGWDVKIKENWEDFFFERIHSHILDSVSQKIRWSIN
jgi:hypothetical protein